MPFSTSDSVPLGFKTNVAGNYTIAIDHVDGLFSNGQAIYLKDNLLNTVTNLGAGSYSFASAAGTFNSRFEIVYQSMLGVNNPEFTSNNVVAFNDNGDISINSGSTVMEQVRVYDLQGRLLVEKKQINTSETRINTTAVNQVLLLEITATTGSKVIKKIISLSSKGTKVYYITGNHDEFLRKFTDLQLGNISLLNKLVLELDDKKAWIFHGDVFDASINHAKWLAKLGGWGYDLLILLNRFINWVLARLNKEPYSLSKKIKGNVKSAVKFISNFENVCIELAIENKFDYVICGHIHEPKFESVETEKGKTVYLNSGDWIENLTALEYNKKQWRLYTHEKKLNTSEIEEELDQESNLAEQFISILNKD
jgi:UDP-2,3-diacylglucosamine pyrophosphatase LpxH